MRRFYSSRNVFIGRGAVRMTGGRVQTASARVRTASADVFSASAPIFLASAAFFSASAPFFPKVRRNYHLCGQNVCPCAENVRPGAVKMMPEHVQPIPGDEKMIRAAKLSSREPCSRVRGTCRFNRVAKLSSGRRKNCPGGLGGRPPAAKGRIEPGGEPPFAQLLAFAGGSGRVQSAGYEHDPSLDDHGV